MMNPAISTEDASYRKYISVLDTKIVQKVLAGEISREKPSTRKVA